MNTPNLELVYHVHMHVIPAALALLPGRMDSIPSRAMLIATGLQESEFNARRQGGRGTRPGKGPARSFWQFEMTGGVTEILTSADTRDIIRPICTMLLYEPIPSVCHVGMQDNDILAACFARLLLYRDPSAMPERDNSKLGWTIYNRRWRPGAPRPDDWPDNFRHAWLTVTGQ